MTYILIALFTGAGLAIYLGLLGVVHARCRADFLVYQEVNRQVEELEKLRDRGMESPSLPRALRIREALRLELEQRSIRVTPREIRRKPLG